MIALGPRLSYDAGRHDRCCGPARVPAGAHAGGKPTAPLPPAAPESVVALEEQERFSIQQALEAAGGNQSQAARFLRIGRDALNTR
jgi:DNA-binding NtrC family response regulator